MTPVVAAISDSRRLSLRILATCCLAAAVVVAAWPMAAEAESPDTTGWWNKLKPELPPSAGNPIPPPPDVPAEGLLVANDPAGSQAFAALRFEATRARKAILTLHAADDEPIAPTADIVACPVLGEWDQAHDAPWEHRPDVDCLTIASPGEISDDGLTVTWQINEEFFRLGVLVNRIEVAVLPNPDSAVPFRAVFERPGFDALVADGPLIEPAGVEGGSGGELAPPELPAPEAGSTFPGANGEIPGTGIPDSGTAPPAGPTGEDTGGDARQTTAIESAAPLGAPGGPGDRFLAAALLALTAAGLFLASGRRAPRPKLIGGLAHRADDSAGDELTPSDDRESREGGVGRFRRLRTREPVS